MDSSSTVAPRYLGGICGWAKYVSLDRCTYLGTINAGDESVDSMGGIVAYSQGATVIKNSGFFGTISSTVYSNLCAGGILGNVDNSAFGGLQNCFSNGNISYGINDGGFFPINYNKNAGAIIGVVGTNAPIANITGNKYSSLSAWGTNTRSGSMPSGAATAITVSENSFASGELCKILNGNVTDGTQLWYQTLGADETPLPDSSSGTVYYIESYKLYTNTPSADYYFDNGTPSDLTDDYVEISTAAQLRWFASQVSYNKKRQLNAKLMADIELNPDFTSGEDGINFGGNYPVKHMPIGIESASYSGTFDGNHKTISGIYYVDESADYVGLFGDMIGTVKNVYLINGYIKANNNVGAVCGSSTGTIEGCSSSVTIDCGEKALNIGGICGFTYTRSVINNCLNTGIVTGGDRVGGISGYNPKGIVKNCLSIGAVKNLKSSSSDVGSICGVNGSSDTTFTNNHYLQGTATDANGNVQKGVGSNVATDPAGFTAVSESTLDTGELCLLLNQSNAGGWYQNLGENKDNTPVPDSTHKPVYFDATLNFYSNYPAPEISDNYYQIDSADDLFWFADAVNHKHLGINGILTENIDLNPGYVFGADGVVSGGSTPKVWKPIADFNATENKYYSGVFDGNNKTISGVYINAGGTNGRGLFSYSSGTIKNLSIENSFIHGNNVVGGVCAGNEGAGNITNCTNRGFVSGYSSIGGVCGVVNAGSITACRNSGTVHCTNSNAGGVCGRMNGGIIQNCYNIGTVYGYSNGGVCGYKAGGEVINCYSLKNAGYGTSMTEAQFHSGEVTYLLNGGKTDGTQVWFQTCGTGYPAFSGNTVYRYEFQNCIGGHKEPAEYSYTNVQTADVTGAHTYENGICKICGEYQPATLLDESSDFGSLGLTTDYIGYYAIGNAGQLIWFEKFVNGTLTDGAAKKPDANAVLTGDVFLNDETFTFNADTGLVAVTDGDKAAYLGTGIKGDASGANTTFDGEASGVGKWYSSDTSKTEGAYEGEILAWTLIEDYNGTFAGNNKSISGLYLNNSNASACLFSWLSGTVRNLSVINGYIRGRNGVGSVCDIIANDARIEDCRNDCIVIGFAAVGGICGRDYSNNGTIQNCINDGIVIGDDTYTGGICGVVQSSNGTIQACTNNGSVTGITNVGGICGSNYREISNCTNNGSVTGTTEVGGICGFSQKSLTNCTNSGSVTGTTDVGGICGNSNAVKMENCTNSGSVKGGKNVGGVCGYNGTITFQNCTNSGSVTGTENVGGLCGCNAGGVFTYQNCTNSGSVSGKTNIGGVCGYTASAISNCINSGTVLGEGHVGGICGESGGGLISNCYNTGKITEIDGGTGREKEYSVGIVGYVQNLAYSINCYFLDTSATSGSKAGESSYNSLKGYAEPKTEAQFRSGEVAYLLNGSRSEGTTESPLVWFQTVGEGYPAFSGQTVYRYEVLNCLGGHRDPVKYAYANVQTEAVIGAHDYDNGICKDCGGYQPATLLDTAEKCEELSLSDSYVGYYAIGNAGQLIWFEKLVNGTLTDGTAKNVYANAVLTDDIVLNNETFVFEPDTGLIKVTGEATAYLGTGIKGNGNGANPTFDTEASVRGAWYASDTSNVVVTNTTAYEEKLRKWTPIGNVDSKYCGIFDGNNKTVSGLYINSTANYTSLFGYICTGSTVKKLNIENGFICGSYMVSGVCGYSYEGIISNCVNSGTVMGDNYVGGVCGSADDSPISNCANSGTVMGDNYVGGVCGSAYDDSPISNCANSGFVIGDKYVGGVCGLDSGISNCSNSGSVTGNINVGGVCGLGSGISNCQSSGTVTGDSNVGGVCGYNYSGTMSNCYNNGTVTGDSNVGGVCGYSDKGIISNCYNTGKVTEIDSATGTAKAHNAGIVGVNHNGTVTNCYYLETSATCGMNANLTENANASPEGQAELKTLAQFNSGEVTYLLNGSRSEGTVESPLVWFQTCGTDYPAFTGNTVYRCEYVKCNGEPKDTRVFTYRNVQGDIRDTQHNYKDGICDICGAYQPPTEVTSGNLDEFHLSADYIGWYAIDNPGQLFWLGQQTYSTSNFVLTNDIHLNDETFTFDPDTGLVEVTDGEHTAWLGTGLYSTDFASTRGQWYTQDDLLGDLYYNDPNAYSGSIKEWNPMEFFSSIFDGNNKTISGLYINNDGENNGLFRRSGATIKNLNIENGYIRGNASTPGTGTGGVCAKNVGSGTISNCTNSCIVLGSSNVGGVCAYNLGTISNCVSSGVVGGSENAGGVCGENHGTISNCVSSGVVGGSSNVGGVCGENHGTIANCANSGSVRGSSNVGGVCGGLISGTVSYCYNTGKVTEVYENGSPRAFSSGIVGYKGSSGSVIYCYYLDESATCGIETKNEQQKNGTSPVGQAEKKTAGQFASGEVTWLLNGSRSQGTAESPLVWFQTVRVGYPAYSGQTVYHYYKYDSEGFGTLGYYNTYGTGTGMYQPATLLDATSDFSALGLDNSYIGYYAIGNAGQLYWFAGLVNGTLSGGTERNQSANGVLTGSFSLNNETFTFDPDTGLVKVTGDFTAYLGTGIKGNSNGDSTYDSAASVRGQWYIFTDNGYETGTYSGSIREWDCISSFSGIFNGNNKTVGGLYINGTADCMGLFGYIYSPGMIKNLNIENSFIHGNNLVSSVCGGSFEGVISNCSNSSIVLGNEYIGGICGSNGGYILNCTVSGTVSGSDHVGGVCGSNGGSISDCTAGVTASGSDYIGGVCGSNGGDISKCISSGTVSGSAAVGGVCGANLYTIFDCTNSGAVMGNSNVGGICGKCGAAELDPGMSGKASYCYNTGNVTEIDATTGEVKTNRAGIVGYIFKGNVLYCYYLSTSATCGINANITSDNANVSPEGQAELKTAAQFASGEVTYLLNGSRSEGTAESPLVWFQTVGEGYPAFTGNVVCFDETASPQYYNEDIISVTIVWGAMEFTHNKGTWNPETHEWEGAGWYPDSTDGNKITVENTGTVAVNVSYSYTKTNEDVAGDFKDSSGNSITNPVALSVGEKKYAWLALTGKPTENLTDTTLGMVTVTLGGNE